MGLGLQGFWTTMPADAGMPWGYYGGCGLLGIWMKNWTGAVDETGIGGR